MCLDNLYAPFREGILQKYGLTIEDLKNQNYTYVGGYNYGDGDNHYYEDFLLNFGKNAVPPIHVENCVCGKEITINCYITKNNDYNDIIVIGKDCAVHFLDIKLHRLCVSEGCNTPIHRGRKDNLCDVCRKQKKNAIKEIEKKNRPPPPPPPPPPLPLTADNTFKVVYLNIPFDLIEYGKQLGAKWSNDYRTWYFNSYNNTIPEGLAKFEISFLNIPYKNKDKFKELGGRWNGDKRMWYIHKSKITSEVYKLIQQTPKKKQLSETSETFECFGCHNYTCSYNDEIFCEMCKASN